jgi:hypothetical protein
MEKLYQNRFTKSEPNRQFVDDFVVLNGKCQNTKGPYLMKYRKSIAPSSFAGIELATKSFKISWGLSGGQLLL